jgi:hypothetical protein
LLMLCPTSFLTTFPSTRQPGCSPAVSEMQHVFFLLSSLFTWQILFLFKSQLGYYFSRKPALPLLHPLGWNQEFPLWVSLGLLQFCLFRICTLQALALPGVILYL